MAVVNADDQPTEAEQETALRRQAWIQARLDEAPDLSDAQIDKIVALLRP